MGEIKVHNETKDIKQNEKGFMDIKQKTNHSLDELFNFVQEEFSKTKGQSEVKEGNSFVPEKFKLKKAAESKGEWLGEKGDSVFIPEKTEAKEALKKYGLDGIKYEKGEPDFSKVSETTVTIDDMTSNRNYNFMQADTKCAEKWNAERKDGRSDWSRTDVREWRHDNKFSWHERSDTKTMDLAQRDIHSECKHFGGVAECKRREKILGGSYE